MLQPDKLKKTFGKVEEENWMLRAFLKNQNPDEVDRIVNDMHRKLFDGFDCIACSNCCKTIVPIVEENEIGAISLKLGLTCDEFKSRYLEKAREDFIINKKPCPFLGKKGCSIYECRPQNCREYPYTDKDEIWTRLINLVENCAVCPVVFEIFERLKKYYKDEFEEYMVEYQELWGDKYSEDECDDMEEWEDDYEFYEQEDWKGLVEYRRRKVK